MSVRNRTARIEGIAMETKAAELINLIEGALAASAFAKTASTSPVRLAALALEFEAPGSAALHEADRGSQPTLGREFVQDALRVVVTRIVEHGARCCQLCEDEFGRGGAAGLRDVEQPAVPLDDAQVLEHGHLAARDRARHGQHRAAERRSPSLLERNRPLRAPLSDPGARKPR